MAEKVLETSVRQENTTAVIELKGEIDKFSESALNRAYAEATAAKPSNVLLNFKSVEYINSTGIALIVSLMAQARKSGVKFIAAGLSDHYMEIFKITRLSDFMTIYPDEASALNSK
ncbi:MAG: STAS domain-containing protein [Chloroflexi bacterium]|nr:STAS domain-containing protein [Chloroflexota bacterium]